MAEEKIKCAHPACICAPEQGSKYCGQYCKDARETLELSCNCGHAACSIAESKSPAA